MTTRNIIRWAVLLLPVCSGTLRAQDIAPMEIGSRAICGSFEVNDPKTIQEAWLNTRIQHPGLVEAMQQWRLQKGAVDPRVGDQNLFWVYNIQNRSYDTIRAELKFIGSISYIWVALSEWNNGHVTSAEVDAMANALERSTSRTSLDSTMGILSIDRQVCGNPPNVNSSFQKGKGDGKTHFLVCDIQDGFTGSNSYVAGFFYAVDVDPSSGATSTSNRRDMLYIDSYPGIYYNSTRRTSGALSTLAHEFQHLIHWNYDPYEITFFNEGLSEYAEYLCGFTLRSPSGYLSNTNVALTGWDGTLEDYSRAALWTRYVGEQYGLLFLKNLTQNLYSGIQGFEASLTQSGISTTFAASMLNFFTANWMGSGGQDPAYRYKGQMTVRPSLRREYLDPNTKQSDTLKQQGVQYISFSGARNFRITFAAPAGVVVRAIESGPAAVRVRDVTSGVEFTSPDLGTTYSSIVFVIMNTQPVLPTIYSYTSFGELLHFLVEEKYDGGTPHTFSQGNAPYLGFGNNATTLGMAVRFQPAMKWNILRKARMMLAFNQEFSNGTALPTDRMNFVFHVWGDRNGRPGSDIVTPFLVNVDRTVSPFGSFVDIDLSAYEKTLTNLSGPIYVGFMEDLGDSVGTYLAVDNYVTEDYSYVYRGPNYNRAPPNTWQTMREVSAMQPIPGQLDGFNLMIRAVFEYSDSSAAPPLTIGYLQNPLLSEYIDVVAASSAELRLGSVSGTLSQTSGSSTLRFNAISGTTKAFIDTTQKLSGSGAVSLRVRAAKKYGVFYADTTISLNARLLKTDAPATVASPSGSVSITFDAGSVKKPIYVTLCDGLNDLQPGSTASSKLLKAFSLGPAGITLNRASTVSVSGLTDENSLTLAMLQDGKWLSIPTTYVQNTGELRGVIDRLGVVGIVKKTDVDDVVANIPTQFSLEQNYPNPFNPTTNFEFRIAAAGFVSLKIFDVLGREVAALVNEERQAGTYRVTWDASKLPSGVYFYRLLARRASGGQAGDASTGSTSSPQASSARDFMETKKMVFAK
ncbi:MAG: T9SS type A sorting domain-containing protein [Ignavibacteriales bacterium]|nr:T9SS type A sorting domain-containing protein [Ignavibacteriales bacterium]